MASFDRGTKRQCEHCATKYYDLNRDPILCPACGKPYEPPAERTASKSASKDGAATVEKDKVEPVAVEPVAPEAKIASFEDVESDADENDAEVEDIPDVQDVEDIGGEVDNSFVENDDDDDDDIEFKVVTPKADE